MAAEAHGEEAGGLVFHPMDQFIVKPFFGDGAVSWYTINNATVWMALAVLAVFALLVLGTSKRSVIQTRMQSVGELAYGFIYKMVEDICGKDGVNYFPYSMTCVHVHRVFELPWPAANGVHHNVAHRCHSDHGFRRILCRYHSGFRQKRRFFLGPVLGVQRATCAASYSGTDRSYLVFRAPRQPLHSFGG